MQDDTQQQINSRRSKISQLHAEIETLQQQREAEPVENYTFSTADGDVSLLQLFGDKNDLIVVHNMGSSCPYCTLWADGFNGIANHIQNRAAFVISSPDSVATQQKFSSGRQWQLTMVSNGDNTFAVDMGYKSDSDYQPGVSCFQKQGDKIHRVSSTPFGPGDDFCSIWHLFAMLGDGSNGWQPKFAY